MPHSSGVASLAIDHFTTPSHIIFSNEVILVDDDRENPDWIDEEPVVVPISDSIDLHHFKPGEVPDLLGEYFHACREEGIFRVRVIHGKGKGILKNLVRRILSEHPHVRSFTDAQMGNWGATCVELEPVKNRNV
jgi:dsDNA-specific endonuclease/ATPase MutS2